MRNIYSETTEIRETSITSHKSIDKVGYESNKTLEKNQSVEGPNVGQRRRQCEEHSQKKSVIKLRNAALQAPCRPSLPHPFCVHVSGNICIAGRRALQGC